MRRGGTIGCGGLVLIVVFSLITGQDPTALLGMIAGSQPSTVQQPQRTETAGQPDEASEFVRVVLASTEDVWAQYFANEGERYTPPRLVLFSGGTTSGCGYSSSAVGPFYCPADSQVYLDLQFFSQLSQQFGAPGDFAAAYVIAHEVGHHIQNELGIAGQVSQMRSRVSRAEGNELSVKMELQADCLAGVWAHHAERQYDLLDEGDVEEGLRAAAAIGDDTLQRRSTGHVQPESWTHGSSEQRVTWFRRGLSSGDLELCDTFS